jgi:alpha-mannosidase
MFNVPVRVVQTHHHEGAMKGDTVSLFSVSNQKIRFSALKKCETTDNYILRLYNPTSFEQTGAVRFNKSIKQVFLTNLNEDRKGEMDVREKKVEIKLKSKIILTMEVCFEEEKQ